MKTYQFENQEFYLLSELLKELNVKSKGHNYCNYLNIKLYQFKHPQSGHISHFIITSDFEKLKEFCEKYNSKERKSICTKFTNIQKYGCENVFQNENIKNKIIEHKIEKYGSMEEYEKYHHSLVVESIRNKYGVDNVYQLDEVKQKSKESIIKHFGSWENYRKQQVEKTKKTKLEKYGDENYTNVEKVKQTKLEKYGDENYHNIDKMKQTCVEKYGVDNYFKTEEGINKIKNMWSKKSKEEMKEIMNKHFHKWIFDNQLFDSKWEIYYYFYLKNNNIKFEREYPFDYYFDNKKCVYLCDFHLIDTNEFIEIKGSHMIDVNGNLKEHYNNDNQNKLNAKTKCMIDNHVKIISKNEIKFYVNYFKENCNDVIIDNKTKEINNIIQ